MNRRQALFIVKFLALIAVFYVVLALPAVDAAVVTPFSAGITKVAAVTLRLFGDDVVAQGTALRDGAFAVEVKNGCNGVEAMLLLASAILAFPSSWKIRAIGAAAGMLTIQIVNLVRVITLFLLARDYPRLFETFHVTIWQTVMFLLAIGIFLFWSSRVAKPADARS
jgi:exosortase H (IPTLxxWG-CTERM-specific)